MFCVHTVSCFKGTVRLARLTNYCVLQAAMKGNGKRERGDEEGETGLHLNVAINQNKKV